MKFRNLNLTAALATALLSILVGCTNNPIEKRTPGDLIDDNALEFVIEREIRAADEGFDSAHLVITVYDGVVLLLGEVASSRLKQKATEETESLYKVDPAKVYNYLTVGGPISMLARTNDGYLSLKVKARLFAAPDVPAGKVKVVTENGIIYLLGKISLHDGDLVVKETRKSFGVQKIVKVFDYLPDELNEDSFDE
jgi:osmotically-inducible protein OsmY